MSKGRSNNKEIAQRREKVMTLLARGLNLSQIGMELRVDKSTISRDVQYLSEQSKKNLNNLAKDTLPFMFQTSLDGIREVLKECWKIYKSEDENLSASNKLNSLKLAKECSVVLFTLVTEGPSLVYLREMEDRLERLEKVEDNKKED